MVNGSAHGEKTKAAIVAKGLDLWRLDPAKVSARKIGAELGMTHAGVLYHFPNVTALKAAIAAEAVRLEDIGIIRQLIVAGNPAVAHLDGETRQAYLAGC